MKKIFLGLVAAFSFTIVVAQNHSVPCITDEVTDEFFKNNPAQAEELKEKFYSDYEQYLQTENASTTRRKSGAVRIIPVVFHVIHTYGDENLSKATLENQMRILNENFRRLNASRVNTRPIFQGDAADCEIEFRLATKDPNGNCTDGITRTYSQLTHDTRDDVKSLIRWDNTKYLNVWVVAYVRPPNGNPDFVSGGFAYLPWSLPGTNAVDGIVVRADGLLSNSSSVLTHEVGHYLGLSHPFQGGCGGSNCATSGDRVCDTPPVSEASSGCNPSANTCSNDSPNLPDQIENYMDYIVGTCQNMFTIGQKARMDASLENWRPLLASAANLIATGTDQPSGPANCAPIADFFSLDNQRSRNQHACAGGTSVDFRDNSYNYSGAITREWIFEGGTPATSTVANPNVTYAQAGKYDVTLIVSNTNGTDTLYLEDYIEVAPSVAEKKAPYTQDFEFPQFPVDGWYTNSTTFTNFRITDVGIGTFLEGNSRTLQAPNGASISGSRFDLFSPSVDLSGVSSPLVSFFYSFAQRSLGSTLSSDGLRVYYSTNCGQSWVQMWARAGSQLSTTGTGTPVSPIPFVPADRSKWLQVSLPIPGNVNATQRQNLRFRFQFISGGGNNFYIDGINFGFPASIDNSFYSDAANFNVYPNPTSGSTNISVNLIADSDVKITVQDILGRTIATLADGSYTQGNQEFAFDTNKYSTSNGIYFVKLSVDGNVYTKKLIQVD